jgi:hypothetical protein
MPVDARWVTCRWCGHGFVVCRACDHGRAYCPDNEACRRGGRREANDRRSDEGREDHRDRMIELRKKQKTSGVTDEHSEELASASTVVIAASENHASPHPMFFWAPTGPTKVGSRGANAASR